MASAIAALRDTVNAALAPDDAGKKNDDLPRRAPGSTSTVWTAAPRSLKRRSMRRVALLALGAFFLFTTFRHLTSRHDSPDSPFLQGNRIYDAPAGGSSQPARPLTGTQPPRTHDEPPPGGLGIGLGKVHPEPVKGKGSDPKGSSAAPGPVIKDSVATLHTYEGPFRFNNLALTILYIGRTGGGQPLNKNVLFAAGSYRSAATLIPMACEMAEELNNYVHFAIVSRDEMPLAELREINGAAEGCQVIFHDARPNNAMISTTARMQMAASRALYHMHMHMHPQAVIVDGGNDEGFFLKGFRNFASEHSLPLIELPASPAKELSFIAKLDSTALAHWHTASVDILIQASPRHVGGLIRLLQSLSSADFSGMSVPHLTIELPQDIEGAARQYIDGFVWPPKRGATTGRGKMLTIRHRVGRKFMSEEDHTVRFMEGFWPSNSKNSHVLVLSPQVEVSRYFFHYLQYAMLYYHYSTQAVSQSWNSRLLGISLDYPTSFLNGTDHFQHPQNIITSRLGEHLEESFLWQAPNSNAVLIFGDKWAETHGLVSGLLNMPDDAAPSLSKQIAKAFPSWLEYFLLLCRTRGYVTLYPSLSTAATLASVHDELYEAPEEYTPDSAEESTRRARHREVRLAVGSQVTSLDTLWRGKLPSLADVPLLEWTGLPVKVADLNEGARQFMRAFRGSQGGCVEGVKPIARKDGSVADMFCWTV